MDLLAKLRHILYADNFVSAHQAEAEQRNQRGIALIAAAAFAVMSLLNIKQKSYTMLASTSVSSLLLVIGYIVSRFKNNSALMRVIFYIIFIVVFTSYTIIGGNDGFAALWLVIATYAVMIAIDFKVGFLISLYYLVMLLLVFDGPLSSVLLYHYNKTFMLRFPCLYAINFAFATYIAIRIRLYQYELLMKQQELVVLSGTDLSTGLMNRNRFIQDESSFVPGSLQTLSAVFIDVNGLHEVNNRDGHDAGDRMLCFIANLCRQYFPYDLVYRMGGDEFLIVRRDAEETETLSAIQRLNKAVEQAGYSISYGLSIQKSGFDLSNLLKEADAKMTEFKRDYYRHMGRNKR